MLPNKKHVQPPHAHMSFPRTKLIRTQTPPASTAINPCPTQPARQLLHLMEQDSEQPAASTYNKCEINVFH